MIHLWYFLSVFPIFSGGCHVFSLWQMFCNLIMIFCLRHLWGSWFWKFLIFSNWSSGSNSFYIHTRVNSSCMLFSLSLKSHNRHSLLHLCAEYCSHFCVLTLWSWRTALCFQICRSFSGWSAVRPNTLCFVCCFQLYNSLPLLWLYFSVRFTFFKYAHIIAIITIRNLFHFYLCGYVSVSMSVFHMCVDAVEVRWGC